MFHRRCKLWNFIDVTRRQRHFMKIIFFAKMTKIVLTPSRDDKVSTMILLAKVWASKKASGFTANQNKLCLELPLMLASTSNDLNRISAVIFFLEKNFSYDIFSNFPNQTQKHRKKTFSFYHEASRSFSKEILGESLSFDFFVIYSPPFACSLLRPK